MFKNVIEQIHHLQIARLKTLSLNRNGRLIMHDGPRTKMSGLYWIYTNYTNDELLHSNCCEQHGSINIANLVSRHTDLSNVCTINVDGFKTVYNGIGGTGDRGRGGLRERIQAEFRGGAGTGSLAINKSSLNDLNKWRYSFVLWSEIEFLLSYDYTNNSEIIERLWRIHYGWPMLCAK